MLKLGKLPPKDHPKTLLLSKYFTSGNALPTPATKVYREYKTPDNAKVMLGNDQYGDCVFAMLCNKIISDTAHAGSVVIPTTEQALAAYAAVTGFNPATGANDNGTVMTDALAYMQSTGIADHKILGWARIDHTNLVHRQIACDLFNGTCVGVNFVQSAEEQFNAGMPFEVNPSSPSVGGHCMLHPGYGSAGDDYVTWAKWDQKASAAWSFAYIDEEYVMIDQVWFDYLQGRDVSKVLDINALWADVKAITAP